MDLQKCSSVSDLNAIISAGLYNLIPGLANALLERYLEIDPNGSQQLGNADFWSDLYPDFYSQDSGEQLNSSSLKDPPPPGRARLVSYSLSDDGDDYSPTDMPGLVDSQEGGAAEPESPEEASDGADFYDISYVGEFESKRFHAMQTKYR